MLTKTLKAWNNFGLNVMGIYLKLPRTLEIILLPVYYVLFVIPYILIMTLLMGCAAVIWKAQGLMTFKETSRALKEGVTEGLNDINSCNSYQE